MFVKQILMGTPNPPDQNLKPVQADASITNIETQLLLNRMNQTD